jgi:hypothetical protein
MRPKHDKTSPTLILVGLALVACFLLTLASLAASQDKVGSAVQRIRSAATPEQVERIIADAKLTPEERAALQKKLKQPEMAAHLAKLSERAVAAAKLRAEARGKQLVLQLGTKQKHALAARNQAARARMAKPDITGAVTPTSVKKATLTPQKMATVRAYRPSSGNPAQLTSSTPDPAVVGSTVTLSGQSLGASPGQVDLLFAATRVSIVCSVASWNDTRVVARVPAGIDALVRSSGEDVLFWVKPDGEDFGPAISTRLVASGVPTIERTSESTIEPGQLLIVEGAGFGARGGLARVRFPSLNQTHDAIVDTWSDAVVVLHLDEAFSGLPREVDCSLELTTASGRTASFGLTFHATIVYHSLIEFISHTRDYYRDEWTDSLFFRETLRNGWQVFTSSAELDPSTSCRHCEITSRPASGSDSPGILVHTWLSDPDCYEIRAFVTVVICGPRGTWYHGGSVIPPT